MIDLGGVVDLEITGTYTVIRRKNRVFVDGILQKGARVHDKIDAMVVPAEGAVQQRDPEGNYQTSTWMVITRGSLAPQRYQYEGDQILLDAQTGEPGDTVFQVSSVQDYTITGGFIAAVVELALQ